MTNHTNLDYLFQLTAIPERSGNGTTPTNGHRKGFDDHLLQASSTSGTGSPNELRSNSKGSAGRHQNHSISCTSERASDYAASGQTEAVATADDAQESEALDEPSHANEVSGDEIVNASADQADEGSESDTPPPDESNEVVVAAAIANGEFIRQSQTAAIADAQTSSDQVDSETKTASLETVPGDQVPSEKGSDDTSKSLPKQFSTPVSHGVEIGSRAEDSNAPSQAVEVGPEDGTANPAHLAAAETGKPASNKEKAKSNARQPHASNVSGVDGSGRNTEDSSERPTISAKDAPDRVKPETADLNQSEKKVRHSADVRGERKDEAATNANRAPDPEVIAAPSTQLTSTTANADGASESSRSASKPIGATGEPVHTPLGKSQRSAGKGPQQATAGQTDDLPRVDAARFVGRVAKAVQVAQERGGALQLRLSPPELGSLRLELTVQNGVMTASLETETPAARQVLLDHLPALRDRLAEQNIRVERFDVDVRQDRQSGGGDPRASQQHERQHQPQQSNPRHSALRASESEVITHDGLAIRPHATNGSINVLA